jgi:hypothetical protein
MKYAVLAFISITFGLLATFWQPSDKQARSQELEFFEGWEPVTLMEGVGGPEHLIQRWMVPGDVKRIYDEAVEDRNNLDYEKILQVYHFAGTYYSPMHPFTQYMAGHIKVAYPEFYDHYDALVRRQRATVSDSTLNQEIILTWTRTELAIVRDSIQLNYRGDKASSVEGAKRQLQVNWYGYQNGAKGYEGLAPVIDLIEATNPVFYAQAKAKIPVVTR